MEYRRPVMSSAVATTAATTAVAPPTILDLNADMSIASRNRLAIGDLTRGVHLWRLALALGWLDIRLRYRGSMLGPFWLTISTGVMVAALGVLYSTLFKMDLRSYLPFLALSQVLWGFLAALVSEGCTAFTDAEGIIRSVRMPLFLFSIRTLVRNIIALAHNVVVIIIVFAVFSLWPGWDALLAIPALLIWMLDALALTLLLGTFCARFRDIQPIVNSVMQIAFFVTPVIWKPEQLGPVAQSRLAWNPFFDLLDIARGPLLGTTVTSMTWLGAVIYSAALCGGSWAFFVRARGRVTFWI
jgi:lipopolysaccharide transport system permease protein